MGPRRRYAVALVLLLAAACGDGSPTPEPVLSAATESATPEAQSTPSTTTTSTAAALAPTTTTPPAPSTTKAPASAPATGTRTTRVAVTPSPPITDDSPAPPPPGVAAYGYGGYGGLTETSAGPVTIELSVYPREQYLGEEVQVWATVSHPENVSITSLRVDYGNGQVVASPVDGTTWFCNTARDAYAGSSVHVYPAPGSFRITATVTFVTCIGVPGAYYGAPMPPPPHLTGPWFPEPHQSLSASIPYLLRPDPRPRPVGPSPGP